MNSNIHKKNQKVIFFERSPFMSVELLDLLDNYKIICYNDDYIYRLLSEDWDLSSYLNIKFNEQLENDEAIEILLSDKNFLNRVIQEKKRSKALFFYINKRIDDLLKNANIQMLLPSYEIQEKLGNKLYLSNICEKINVNSNSSLVFDKTFKDFGGIFTQCKNLLRIPFIVQGALGVSGEDTFLINTEKELQKITKRIQKGFKATKYIQNNIPVSVHLCILNDQIIIQGPFLQLLGFSELSAKSFEFTGNDTNQSLLNKTFIKEIQDMSIKIGKYVKTEGYRGILGIDYLCDKDKNIVYVQELNTRLVGLTRLLTGIQKDQFIFPDLLKHIEAFNTPSYSEKCKNLHPGKIVFPKHNYSQVIINNTSLNKVLVLRRLEPSIYKVKDGSLKKIKSSLFVHNMEIDDVLITYAAHEGCEVYPGKVLTKIILKSGVLKDNEYKLKKEIIELVELIKRHLIGT